MAGAERYRVTVEGPVAETVVGLIRDRFGAAAVRAEGSLTVLDGPIADQAALRALLALLWDTGSHVRSLRVTTIPP
jgi:hypothetical protein